MRIDLTATNPADLRRQGKVVDRVQKVAMHKAVDRATRLAQKGGQQKARAAGLGRLSNAIGYTSSERKRRRDDNNAWGAVFARGGDQSRAGQALEIYTSGGTIRGRNRTWLAIATRAMPKRIGRYRMTPQRYEDAGSPMGPLVFHQVTPNRAYLIIQGEFSVSRKTGKAKQAGTRVTRSSVRKRDIIAFVLIRETRRAKRFDQVDITRRASQLLPRFMEEEMQPLLERADVAGVGSLNV